MEDNVLGAPKQADPWKELANFVRKQHKQKEQDGEEDDVSVGDFVDSDSEAMREIDEVEETIQADLEERRGFRRDPNVGLDVDVGFRGGEHSFLDVPLDDERFKPAGALSDETSSSADEEDGISPEEDEARQKERHEAQLARTRRRMEEDALMTEYIKQGIGFKEIERMNTRY